MAPLASQGSPGPTRTRIKIRHAVRVTGGAVGVSVRVCHPVRPPCLPGAGCGVGICHAVRVTGGAVGVSVRVCRRARRPRPPGASVESRFVMPSGSRAARLACRFGSATAPGDPARPARAWSRDLSCRPGRGRHGWHVGSGLRSRPAAQPARPGCGVEIRHAVRVTGGTVGMTDRVMVAAARGSAGRRREGTEPDRDLVNEIGLCLLAPRRLPPVVSSDHWTGGSRCGSGTAADREQAQRSTSCRTHRPLRASPGGRCR
jgi:hypothetical protein